MARDDTANKSPVDFNDPYTANTLQRLKNAAENEVSRNSQNFNETERSLCGQAMLFTTVLLTGSVFLLGDTTSRDGLTSNQAILILAALISLFGSALFGFMYFFEMLRFYKNNAYSADARLDILDNPRFKTWEEGKDMLNDTMEDTKPENDYKLLIFQLAFLGAASIAYICLIMSLLFDFAGLFDRTIEFFM